VRQIKASIAGNVWKILVQKGQEVAEDDEVVILESMKMEIPIESPGDGVVDEILVTEGQAVQQGQVLVVLG
jgi:acetyl-CoA carboxylase biotin carboxyl carrier protein